MKTNEGKYDLNPEDNRSVRPMKTIIFKIRPLIYFKFQSIGEITKMSYVLQKFKNGP